MAKNPDDPEIRFPLRRADVPARPAPSPAPAPRSETQQRRAPIAWLPRLPRKAEAPEPERQWFEGAEPFELTEVAPKPQPQPRPGPRAWTGPTPPPPPPPPPQLVQPPAAEPPAPGSYTTNLPVLYRPSLWRWVSRGAAAFVVLFVLAVGWLALTAPLSKSLEPPAPPSITLYAADGKTAIARRGADIGDPVDVSQLPAHVRNAFVAIEDRRFYSHWGVDPRGLMRALVHNMTSSDGQQGGSTITQQLAKNAFLNSSRTVGRKFQEALIAFWLEAWLSKDQILSRYLSNVYFGDNVYGLTAAARHYFSVTPDRLTVSQASMLAGLVQAPSRLAPTGNLAGARARQKLVVAAMLDTRMLSKAEAAAVRPAVLHVEKRKPLPSGGYFADWILPEAREAAGGTAGEREVTTTLDARMQAAAERAVRNIGLKRAQIAIVAMRPDGRVVAMVGGTNYGDTPFNRATQARRQPGSTFKLFVYLAALRGGAQLDDIVDDSPVNMGGWTPENSHGYSGKIPLQQAFAQSSNVVAARLTQRYGVRAVTQAARDLGISTPIGNDASIALGTSTVSLLELTAAYASVARGAYPVRPKGIAEADDLSIWGRSTAYGSADLANLRRLLAGVVQSGTGRGASLSIPAYGKTGTTQDNRDAWFVGYAGEGEGALVAGVWIGNDDNTPNAALSGGGIPARVWRDFMSRALGVAVTAPAPAPVDNTSIGNESDEEQDPLEALGIKIDQGTIETVIDTLTPTPTPIPAPTAPSRREDPAPPPAARNGSEQAPRRE